MKDKVLVDLTGGLGVDSFFFSNVFKSICFVEPDSRLVEIAKHNPLLAEVGTNDPVGLYQELGTATIPPRPFMRPAGYEEGKELEKALAAALVALDATIRDAIVLALPQAPLCRDDCPGLCPQCGVRLADEPGHRHEARDPRWAALAGLLTVVRPWTLADLES